jgi:hypothetical protein
MTTERPTRNELDRREFIRRASAAAVVGSARPMSGASDRRHAGREQLRRRIPGAFRKERHRAVREEVRREGRARSTGTSSQDYAKIRASKGDPGFDVAAALSPPEVMLGAKEGLLEKITDKEVPNLKYTWEKARQTLPPVAVIHTLQFDSLLYNKDKLDKPDRGPTTGSRTRGTGPKSKATSSTTTPPTCSPCTR